MAETPRARGGARPGAGGKAKMKPGEKSKPLAKGLTAQEYFELVMNDPTIEAHRRDRAAMALLTLDRQARSPSGRVEAVGKREQARRAGAAAAKGKFATPAPPPRLVVSNG